MDDLPELPFKKVLSYLSLEDVIKARAVSRKWHAMISSFKMKSLCFAGRPRGFIWRKDRWVSGAFAQNFISSTRFASFFSTFGPSMLCNLKHLRLCDQRPSVENATALAPALNSFAHLEQLDIIRFRYPNPKHMPTTQLELNLPMLSRIHLEEMFGVKKLTLDAPKLKQITLAFCTYLELDLVHGESVERMVAWDIRQVPMKQLKNLKQLYTGPIDYYPGISPTLLFDLPQLKEIHLRDLWDDDELRELFEHKRQHGRADLKIYMLGLLLDGPDDPAITPEFNGDLGEHTSYHTFSCLANNPSRLADEIPFQSLLYDPVERFATETANNVLKRFTDNDSVFVYRPIEDVERFLDFLKTFDNIVIVRFHSDQPQELYDRLPEHCAAQRLHIQRDVSDLQFLLRMKHLKWIYLRQPIDAELLPKVLKGLPHLTVFEFRYVHDYFELTIRLNNRKRFEVSSTYLCEEFADPDALIKSVDERRIKLEKEIEEDEREYEEDE